MHITKMILSENVEILTHYHTTFCNSFPPTSSKPLNKYTAHRGGLTIPFPKDSISYEF